MCVSTSTLVLVSLCVLLETHTAGVHHTIVVVVTGACTHLVWVESALVGLVRVTPGHSLSRRSWLEALVGWVHATISLRRGHLEVVGRLLGLEERGATTSVV